ncbi:MAG: hypothetical protein RBR97_15750 [Bacteroidales bacterium]|jgi:hypothetical protein|nr:hypothetical protein [Bacteroidales bacterium]
MEENMKSGVLQSMGIVFEKSKNRNPLKMLEFGGHFETLLRDIGNKQNNFYPLVSSQMFTKIGTIF